MADSDLEWGILLDTIVGPRRTENGHQHAADILSALAQFLRRESLDREAQVCVDVAASVDDDPDGELNGLESMLESLCSILNKENDGRVSCVHELLEWVDERRFRNETR